MATYFKISHHHISSAGTIWCLEDQNQKGATSDSLGVQSYYKKHDTLGPAG